MNEREAIEGTKDHVHLPADTPQKGRHGKSENAVPCPVGSRGERHGLGTDLGREDLRRVRPRGWTPGSSKASHEKVRTGDNGLGDASVLLANDPGNVFVGFVWVRATVSSLQCARDEQPHHHEEGANKQSGTTTELVEPEDGGEGKGDVDNVLDRGGEELVGDTSALHDKDDVVHHNVHA